MARIAELGFDGVEICLEHPDCLPGDLDVTRAREIGAMVSDAGLAGRSVSLHVDYIHDDARFEQSLKGIRLTRALGGETFIFAGSTAKLSADESWRRMVERTRRMADVAVAEGVRLAIEFEPNFVVGNTAGVLKLDRGGRLTEPWGEPGYWACLLV